MGQFQRNTALAFFLFFSFFFLKTLLRKTRVGSNSNYHTLGFLPNRNIGIMVQKKGEGSSKREVVLVSISFFFFFFFREDISVFKIGMMFLKR